MRSVCCVAARVASAWLLSAVRTMIAWVSMPTLFPALSMIGTESITCADRRRTAMLHEGMTDHGDGIKPDRSMDLLGRFEWER